MPITIDVEVRGLEEIQKKTEQVITDMHGQPILQAFRDAGNLITRDAKKAAPVDRGGLRASITPEVRLDGQDVIGVVGSNKEYAAAMELGTKPFWPPVFILAEWVRRKRLAGVYSAKTRRRMGSTTQQAVEDIELAWMIALKISHHGLKARPYLQPAFEKNERRVIALIERAVEKIVEK